MKKSFQDRNEPEQVVDQRDVSQPLKQLMKGLGDKISYFLPGFYVREEVEEKSKTSFDDPHSFASSEFVETRTKAHHLDEGLCVCTKKEGFHQRSK